jgi:hypothetical protein
MRYAHFCFLIVTCLSITLCAGCGQQAGGIFYEAGQAPVIERTAPILVADEPAANAAPTTQPTTAATTQPVAYTSPRGNIRQLAFLALLGAAGTGSTEGTVAKDASEAGLASARALTAGGAASLAAPQPRTLAAVVGQSGLQKGYAAGLGFSRTPNIFTAQANPLSGPNGRGQELINAGFFPNAAAYNRFFKK